MSEPWFQQAEKGARVLVPAIGVDMTVLAPAGATGDALCLIQERTAPGGGPPLHVHHRQSELFYFLEGRYELAVGDRRFTAGPGDTAVVPPGVPHAFHNPGPEPGRFLFLLTPALDSERFFAELARFVEGGPPDPEALNAFAAPYGVEFVGPPLGATPASPA